MQIKTCNAILNYKAYKEKLIFSGYASFFNIVDKDNDVMVSGCFKNSFNSIQDVKLLWQHDASKPIGLFHKIQEDSKGLYVEGEILTQIQQGKEACTLINEKIVDGLSIGFELRDKFFDKGIRYICDVELWEISIVTFPANNHARITSMDENIIDEIDKGVKALRALSSAIY